MNRNSYYGNLRRNTPQDRLQREVAYRHFLYTTCIVPVFEKEIVNNIDEEVVEEPIVTTDDEKVVEEPIETIVDEEVRQELPEDIETKEEVSTDSQEEKDTQIKKPSYYGHGRYYIPQDRNVRLVSLRHRPYPMPIVVEEETEIEEVPTKKGLLGLFGNKAKKNSSKEEKASQQKGERNKKFNDLIAGLKTRWQNFVNLPIEETEDEDSDELQVLTEKSAPSIVKPQIVEEIPFEAPSYYGHGRYYIPQDRNVRQVSLRHRPYPTHMVIEEEDTPIHKGTLKVSDTKELVAKPKKPKLTRAEKKQLKIQRKQDWLDEMIDRPKIRWFNVITRPITYMHTVYEEGTPTIDGCKGCILNLITLALISMCFGLLAYNHVSAHEFSIARINFIDFVWISLRVFGFGVVVALISHLFILIVGKVLHKAFGRRELVCGLNCSIVTILLLYLVCVILMYFVPSMALVLFVVVSLLALFLRVKAIQISTDLAWLPLVCILGVIAIVVTVLSLNYYNTYFMDLHKIFALL